MRSTLTLAVLLSICIFGGCASQRAPVPPGTIPAEHDLSAEDEQYGHAVLGELSQKYPLDRNDAHINRVRDIVDKITEKGIGSKNPWHVYVMVSADFKNAAATRGDYIFVWTGLLDALKSDDELATVLSHEIGHVLAGHTAADPTEEATQILSGAVGSIASQVLQMRGLPGVVGDLAGELLEASLNAVIVNPGQRSKELEADLIGMFLMAKSGIDPKHAVDFWRHVQFDPDFSNSALTFLSTHPSSDDRLKQLEQYLPDAESVFHGKSMKSLPAALKSKVDRSAGFAIGKPEKTPPQKELPIEPRIAIDSFNAWQVEESSTPIYSGPSDDSSVVGKVTHGDQVSVEQDLKRWLRISAPQAGYVRSRDLSPLRNSRSK